MSAREEIRGGKKTGRWYFRKQLTLNGQTTRLFGIPEDYGQPNNKTGAKEAERIALERLRAGAAPAVASAPAVAVATVGEPPPPPRPAVPTLREFLPTWLAKSASDDRPSTTTAKTLIANAHFLPAFGDLRLDQIDFPKVEAWRLELLKTMAPSSVASYLQRLRSLLSYAHQVDVLPRLPRWPSQRVPQDRPEFLTFDQADRLIAAAEPLDPWKAMVIVAVRTGLRHGELTALRWQDVDLDGGKLSVVENYVKGHTGKPKSGKEREVPLSNDAIKALRALRHQRGPLVFCTPAGRHLQAYVTDDALRLICRRASMLPFGWHRLRHTFASHLAMRGVSLKVIQDLMGHANIKMTLRYAHLMPEVRHDAVRLLDLPTPKRRS